VKSFRVTPYAGIYFLIAAVLMAASVVLLAVRGLNWGIDFTGGTLLERGFTRPVTAAEVREALTTDPAVAELDLGNPVVQPLGEGREVLIRVRPLQASEIERLDDVLAGRFGEVTDRRTEVVGPVIGRELVHRALWALALSLVGILIYVTFRFEFRSGVVAIAALVHDVLISLGVVSLLGLEINTPFVAAILTVVGYSLNDTIIVFDRIRENRIRHPRLPLFELVDRSLHETLARSINTSLTTLLVVGALLFFGGVTLRDFLVAMAAGLVSGSYSSIFLASPLWAYWMRRTGMRAQAARPAEG